MSQSSKVLKEFGSVSTYGGVVDVISGSGALGAVSLACQESDVRTTGASTGTLADGAQGQRKTITMTVDGGDYVLTPANLVGASSTLTFGDVGDSVTLVFLKSDWHIACNNGVAVA